MIKIIILVIAFYAAVGFLEISALINQNKKKEIILYSFMFGIAFILSVLLTFEVPIPSPVKPIENTVKAFNSLFK